MSTGDLLDLHIVLPKEIFEFPGFRDTAVMLSLPVRYVRVRALPYNRGVKLSIFRCRDVIIDITSKLALYTCDRCSPSV